MGGLLSGILGGGNSAGQQQQMQALKASRDDIQRYRPEAMQARLNALANMTGSYQGANNALETLWGAPQKAASPSLFGREAYGPSPPQRLMGHDLPSEPQPAPQGQRQPDYFGSAVSTVLDPLGIFGGR